MGHLGIGELLLIGGIIVLIFGAKRLPELGKSLGEAIREFQKSIKGPDRNDKP